VTAGFPVSPLPGLHRPLSDSEADSLDKYLKILTKWQRAHRLVGSTDRAWLIEHIVVDRIAFLGVVPSHARRLVDIGSGAGVPGVPIAVVCGSMEVVMVEAMRRRASFLSTVVRELGLPNAHVLEARVEHLTEQYERTFDVAVMRCAGPAADLLPHAMRLVRHGGCVIAASGPEPTPVESDVDGGQPVAIPHGDARRHFRVWSVK
jgi:16S rRNA (guanine527-N7)-methyltransferase